MISEVWLEFSRRFSNITKSRDYWRTWFFFQIKELALYTFLHFTKFYQTKTRIHQICRTYQKPAYQQKINTVLLLFTWTPEQKWSKFRIHFSMGNDFTKTQCEQKFLRFLRDFICFKVGPIVEKLWLPRFCPFRKECQVFLENHINYNRYKITFCKNFIPLNLSQNLWILQFSRKLSPWEFTLLGWSELFILSVIIKKLFFLEIQVLDNCYSWKL